MRNVALRRPRQEFAEFVPNALRKEAAHADDDDGRAALPDERSIDVPVVLSMLEERAAEVEAAGGDPARPGERRALPAASLREDPRSRQ